MRTIWVATEHGFIQQFEPDWHWLDGRPVITKEEQLIAALRYIQARYGHLI